MSVKLYNISKPTKYTDKDGNEKTRWNTVGIYKEFTKEGGQISRALEIPAIGLEAQIFPFEAKGSSAASAPAAPQPDDIQVENIPF